MLHALLTRRLALCLLLFSACVPFSAPLPAARVKFLVSADGLYRVSAAQLRDAGVALDGLDPAALQLLRGDRAIAIRVVGEGNDLAIEFYGQASDSPYSAFNVYWLTWDAPRGKRMREITVLPARDTPQRTFQDTLRVTQPTLYVPQAASAGAPWFWQSLSAPMTTTIPLTLVSGQSAPARARVELWGSTLDAVAPDHHVIVLFNDTRVADETWDGQGAHVVDAPIPPGVLRAGANTLRLIAPGDTRANADVVLLRSIEITYTRALTARDDALTFEVGPGNYRIEGFSQEDVDLFDITEPDDPGRVANARGAAGALTFQSDAPRRWLALTPNARRRVARIVPLQATDLRATDRQADYVVITSPVFFDALEPLVQWRERHGLRVRVVTTDEIYDEFGYGAESPHAIRAFLDYAYHRWASPAPRFALLVGKASYDYRDYLNAPNKNLLPTYLLSTLHLNQAGSDHWYVASADDVAQMAIGRLPAKTPAQLMTLIAKIVTYESAKGDAAWRRRALFVADDQDAAFETMSERLIGALAPETEALRVYLRTPAALAATRQALLEQWNRGARIVTYAGHGAIESWAAGPLFDSNDVGALSNGERLPFLFTPTCLDGFFYHPQQDSLTEQLLARKDGGIIAGLVPTGLSLTPAQEKLGLALFDALFRARAGTIGEAIVHAKRALNPDDATEREVIDTFTLLGDPALRWATGEASQGVDAF